MNPLRYRFASYDPYGYTKAELSAQLLALRVVAATALAASGDQYIGYDGDSVIGRDSMGELEDAIETLRTVL